MASDFLSATLGRTGLKVGRLRLAGSYGVMTKFLFKQALTGMGIDHSDINRKLTQ